MQSRWVTGKGKSISWIAYLVWCKNVPVKSLYKMIIPSMIDQVDIYLRGGYLMGKGRPFRQWKVEGGKQKGVR